MSSVPRGIWEGNTEKKDAGLHESLFQSSRLLYMLTLHPLVEWDSYS